MPLQRRAGDAVMDIVGAQHILHLPGDTGQVRSGRVSPVPPRSPRRLTGSPPSQTALPGAATTALGAAIAALGAAIAVPGGPVTSGAGPRALPLRGGGAEPGTG